MFAGTGGLTVTAIIRIVSGSIKNTPMVSVISRFSLRPAHAVQAQAVGFFFAVSARSATRPALQSLS